MRIGIDWVVAGQTTVSLREVFFTIAPTAMGPMAITLQSPGTSAADLSGRLFLPERVNAEASITPQPVQVPLVAGSLALLALGYRRQRRLGGSSRP